MSTTADSRRRLPAAQRRESILAAARELFVQHGYEATTTRMIATHAGVTDALIYRHFRSKQDVLLALVEQMTTEFAAMASAGPDGHQDQGAHVQDLLAAIGTRFANVFDTHLDLVVLLLTHREIVGRDRRFVTFIDSAAQGLGRLLDPADPDHGYLLARGFMGAIASFALLQRTLGLDDVRRVDVHDYVAAIVAPFAGSRRTDRVDVSGG